MSSSLFSANYPFLKRFDPQLVRLGRLAERYCKDEPCTCLIKLRQYGELLAQLTAAKAELYKAMKISLTCCAGRDRRLCP